MAVGWKSFNSDPKFYKQTIIRIVLMPGTASEKIFSFDAREIKEGELAGKIPAVDFRCIVTDGTMSVKYVMSYYILKEV